MSPLTIHGNSQAVRTVQPNAVDNQANVSRAGANQQANAGGVANAYLHRVRSPLAARVSQFASTVGSAVVRLGRSAVTPIVNGFSRLQQVHAANRQRAAEEAALPGRTFTFTHPQTNAAFTLSGSMFKDMISALPKNERMAAINSLQADIQRRIDNGAQVYNDVRNATGNVPPANVKNVSDFTLYMYATAAAQGDGFSHGSFNISDPNGNLASWLDSSQDVYVRSSSHLKGIQGEMVVPAQQYAANGSQVAHRNVQRGIDIPKTRDTALPAEFKTITYGSIVQLPGCQGERRLFLKAESSGCRLSTISSSDASFANSGIQQRSKRASDFGQAIGHTLSYFSTRGQQNAAGCRKEHFPKDITIALENWRDVDMPASSKAAILTVLDCGCEKGGFGLRILNARMEALSTSTDPHVISFLQDIGNAIQSLDHFGDLNVRLGNEVVID